MHCCFQYDTSRERDIIQQVRAEREAIIISRQPRQPNIAPNPVTTTSTSNPVSTATSSNSIPSGPLPPTTSTASYGMLVPTRATTASSYIPPSSGFAASGAPPRTFDPKDFESEQDPFEQLSLRVMNDREELHKIFNNGNNNGAVSAAAVFSSSATTSSAAAPGPAGSSHVLGSTGVGSVDPTGAVAVETGSGLVMGPNAVQYSVVRDHLLTSPLRPARSTPDISTDRLAAVGAHEYADEASVNINISQEERQRMLLRRTPPPYSCVTNTWTAPSVSQASPRSDIYQSMSPESQQFVDRIVDMGFSEDDVSRTVEQLGCDERLVCVFYFYS